MNLKETTVGDTTLPFHGALDKAYGSKNDFKTFVDECHTRGIAVIVDVVYNHAFSKSPLAQMYWDSTNSKPAANNPYLNPDATHPFNVGYDFNHENPYTKTYVKQTLARWIDEYKVDGFRFDLSKGFTQNNNPNNVGEWSKYDASRIAILQDYASHIWTNHSSDAYMILEHLADNSEEVVLANSGFMLWGNMNHNYNQNTMGWTGDTEISWISHKSRGYNSPHVVGYMESHDEERLMYKNLQFGNNNNGYNVKDLNTSLVRQELAGCFFLPIPGPKMIWQFGELGYETNIDFNGRTGRKPIHWEYFENSNRKNIYDTWSKLARLKTGRPEFNTNNFSLDTGGLVKRIHLVGDTEEVIIIGNFDVATQSKDPAFSKNTTWYELFSETSITINNSNKNTPISLQPGEYKLYSTKNYQDFLPVEKIKKSNETVTVYPNPTSSSFSMNLPATNITILDTSGRFVKTFNGDFEKNHVFNIQNLKSGIYFIKAETAMGIMTNKIIKL
jgi:1,4-alpha-glucan branching enzyme